MQKLLAVCVLALVSCTAAIAGVKESDFPLRADIADSTKSESTRVTGYQLGDCTASGYCTPGHDVTHTSVSAVSTATIDGVVYVIAGKNPLNPGIYFARLNGKTMELLGKDAHGKLMVMKAQILSTDDPKEVCTAAKCPKPLN